MKPMATLIDTVQPSESDVEMQLTSARGNRSEAEWLGNILVSLNENLQRQPKIYVSFGPWWHAIKNILIKYGYDSYGQLIQIDVAAIYQMSRDALTVCAGLLYHSDRIDGGMIYNREHMLEINESADDTEPYPFTIEDGEMDRLVQQRSNLNDRHDTGLSPGTNAG